MSTFEVRINDKIGTLSDTTAISDFLTAGAKFFVNILPPHRLEKFTTNLTDAGRGISVVAYRVFSANKSGYGARRVPQELSAQVASSSSIHYAGSTDPAWYILNGLAYVKPSGGTVVAMAYPSVLYTDSTITAFPSDLDEGVVLYACIHGRLRQMSDLTITTLGGLSIETIEKPIAPSSPSFTYTDAVRSDASYTSADYTPAVYVNALIDTISATTYLNLTGSFGLTVDGAGSVITSGIKGYAVMPYNATITGWDIIGDVSGSCSVDVWKNTTVPTSANTITGSEIPTLTNQQINSDNNLTTWSTGILINDIIAFNVISASTVSRINLIIKVIKT
jgi:hypothetical protein